MYSFFETLAVAFAISLALYEGAVYALSLHRAFTLSSRVRKDLRTGKMGLDWTSPPLSAKTRLGMAIARYRNRSLVLHQWHHWLQAEEPEFRPYPYALWALLGTLAFGLSGAAPWLAAAGIGSAGALVAFVSKYGRDVLLHSDECSHADDIERNLQLRVALARKR